jgi:hypothetical protein
MATKEEIKEYFGKERWSMLQGAIIFFFVVGFIGNVTVLALISYLVTTFVLGLVLAKFLWWIINKVLKENLKHSANWYLRLIPTILHLTIMSFV